MFSTAICLLASQNAHAQLLTGYSYEPEKREAPLSEHFTDDPVQIMPDAPQKEPPHRAETLHTPQQPQPSSLPVSPELALNESYKPLLTYNESSQDARGEPVDLDAETLSYDEGARTVTASGDVFIEQGGRILRADEVRYNLAEDQVTAQGSVVLNEPGGAIHLADRAEYRSELKDGEVENLRSTLEDGSTFTAERGEMRGGTKTTMHAASYTPCIPCEESDKPTWALRAAEVTHDEEEARVSYKHARFELWGVPVAYAPYFSHPDGSIEQKSGFLSPAFGYKSELGAFVESSYYWAIAPDQDVTLGVMAMTDQSPLGLVEYRKRWDRAAFEIEGGITDSDRKNRTSGQVVREDDETRGHVFAKGRWDMNDKWRSGLNVNWTSDDQYMRQYDFTNEDVLENEVYAERFSGRNYASARMIAYQDIRVREDRALDQPNVVPEVVASFLGEPGSVPLLKGRWSAEASALGLRREGDEQDVNRLSLDLGWQRRLVSDTGLLTTVKAKARGDFYHVNDKDDVPQASGRSVSGSDIRGFPQAHVDMRYPMVKPLGASQATLEPIVALTVAPQINIVDDDNIPNEDSNDVQIDASNLFETNRFPGMDRLEDESRATYGLRSGLYAPDGSYGNVFFGQSYRFDDENNPFPAGSGLNGRESDVVGQISGRYRDMYTLDYRFQLSSRYLTSERHEVDASADWNRFSLNGQYLFAKGLEGTEIDQSREQVHGNAAFYFNPRWRARAGATHDFGENNGLRQVYSGLDYLGQCVFLSLTGEKNYTTEASGESGTEILLRVGLRNLGEFEETTYKPAKSPQQCAF